MVRRRRHSDMVPPTEALAIARARARPRRVRAVNFRMLPDALGEQLLAATLAVDDARARKPTGPRPADDGWWRDVLLDPRARTPADAVSFEPNSIHAAARLDRQQGPVTFLCPCGIRRVMTMADLLIDHPPDTNILWLARKVIDCGNRDKVANYCRAYAMR